MSIDFNTGRWTDEEHRELLRGLQMYGPGNWNAIAALIPSRSLAQIQAHYQHFIGGGNFHLAQREQSARETLTSGESPSTCSSSSWSSFSPSLSGTHGSEGGGEGGSEGVGQAQQGFINNSIGINTLNNIGRSDSGNFGYGGVTHPAAPHLVVNHVVAPQPEELNGAYGALLPPVADIGLRDRQGSEASLYDEIESQEGEDMMGHDDEGSDDPASGEEVGGYFGIGDFCGVL